MDQALNGTPEDLAAILGYTAAQRLMAGYGGGILKIPTEARDSHPLTALLGQPAMQALCRDYGGEHLWIPHHADDDAVIIRRAVARMVSGGHGNKAIATLFGVSDRQVMRWRADAEGLGFLKMVLEGRKAA